MLGRAISRPLRIPASRAVVINSLQWRGLASNNRNKGGKKPTDYSRPAGIPNRPSSVGPQRQSVPGSASAGAAQSTSDSSRQQSEYDGKAGPDRNRVWQGQDQHSARSTNARQSETAGMSGEQPEFGTQESQSTSTEPTSESSEATRSSQPLPDLTRGIPSTIEYELTGRHGGREGEDPAGQEETTGASGRGRGELPASAYITSSEKRRLRFANYAYVSFAALFVTGVIYLGRNWESEEEEKQNPDAPSGWSLSLMWKRANARMGDQLSYYHEPAFQKLLPDPDPSFERPYTLVLSLEDLLIHNEWSREHGWRMAKRPGVDYFLRYLSQYYELVIFTSIPFAMAEPVIKKLDPYHIVTWPLFREATMYKNGEYVKDLSYLNRDLSKVILIDTVEGHAREQPENAIILPKWTGSRTDKELISLIPFLEYLPTMAVPDVRKALDSFSGQHIPTEFAKREAVARKRFEAQMAEERAKKPKSGLGWVNTALGVKPMTMSVEGEQSPAEAFAQGKMLQDQARERGQKNYEALEKMIREEGEKWLKEEAANEEAAKQEGLKAMKTGFKGFFGVPGQDEQQK